VVANIFAMQSRMLREKDERISHLEERHWETVIAAEQLVSDHHRRQLENRAADQKAATGEPKGIEQRKDGKRAFAVMSSDPSAPPR
jgi:hypothetical protein